MARPLPIFSMYLLVDSTPDREPKGFVTFYLSERIPRVNQIFLLLLPHSFLSLYRLDARMDQSSFSTRTRICTKYE